MLFKILGYNNLLWGAIEMKVLKESISHALHELELEGVVFTDEEIKVFNRIASGEITTDQAREIFLSLPLE